jgi:hypothetical protein
MRLLGSSANAGVAPSSANARTEQYRQGKALFDVWRRLERIMSWTASIQRTTSILLIRLPGVEPEDSSYATFPLRGLDVRLASRGPRARKGCRTRDILERWSDRYETSLRQFDTGDPPHDTLKALQFNRIERGPEVASWLHSYTPAETSNGGHEQDKETVMSVKYRIVFSMAITILAATASLAEVKTDYDRTTEFSRWKTYSWGKVHTQNPLWGDRIKAAKGLTEVESGGDVYSNGDDRGSPHSQHLLRQLRRRLGLAALGRRIRRWLRDIDDNWGDVQGGTLVVDLFDTNTQKLIWRGAASDTLSDKSDKNIKKLNSDVEKMFDHFPPGVKK